MHKYILTIMSLLILMCGLVHASEIWVDTDGGNDDNVGTRESPIKSPNIAVGRLGEGGGIVHINADGFAPCYESLHPGMIIYDKNNPLIIDGHNNTIFYGFDGDFDDFDPINQPVRNYHVVGVMDCHNVIFKNFETWGGVTQAFGLNDSYPDVGLHHITLDNITVRYGRDRGIFMGGSNISNIKILNSHITETAYGDVTHGIYLSGGIWSGDYPPIRHITIKNTTVSYSTGRHGIQLNGRFEHVMIENCSLFHNELAGISLMGCRFVEVKDCLIYGNHKQGIVISDYFDDHYWDPDDEASVTDWRSSHHSSGWMYIHHNTIVVGPTQWHRDGHHNNIPGGHGCIAINNAARAQIIDYEMGPYFIYNNILWTPGPVSLALGSQYKGYHGEANMLYVHNNIVWSSGSDDSPLVVVHRHMGRYSYDFLEGILGNFFINNSVHDPEFNKIPVYDFVDLTKPPYRFNWSEHISSADLFSIKCRKLGIGRRKR